MTVTDTLRLARFFGGLAVKEHFEPDLAVRPLVAELFLTENCNLRCISCNCWRRDDPRRALDRRVEGRHRPARRAAHPQGQLHRWRAADPPRCDRADRVSPATPAVREIAPQHQRHPPHRPPFDRRCSTPACAASTSRSTDPTPSPRPHPRRARGVRRRPCITCGPCSPTGRATDLKVRMNFTVMRDNLRSLPGIAALAQELGVRLYLNLATDRRSSSGPTRSPGRPTSRSTSSVGRWPSSRTSPGPTGAACPATRTWRTCRRHFTERLQRDLPCAESQLKLMIHSRGEIGGCWGHDPTLNVRERRSPTSSTAPTTATSTTGSSARTASVAARNYSLNLRWRPSSYMADVLWRVGARHLGAS